MEFKKIEESDKIQVFKLIDTVINDLDRKEFFIPYSEEEKKEFFNNNYSHLYGGYDGNKLVAMSQLIVDNESIEEYYDILNIKKSENICELAGYLVLKEYRKKGIMTKLSKMIYKLASELEFDYAIATAHPENISSNIVLKKTGLELFDTIITSSGYLRNIYLKKLKEVGNNDTRR